MADIGKAIHVYLQTQVGVTNLASTRGYPEQLPVDPTLEAYTYSVVSSNEVRGLGNGASGVGESRVQIDAVADTHIQAQALAAAIRAAMLKTTPITMDTLVIDRVYRDGQHTSVEPPVDGDDANFHIASQDFVVTHDETII